MNSGQRLELVVKHYNKNLTRFCSEHGFSKSTVSNYVRGRKMDSEFIETLYHKLKVNPTWLLTGEGEMFINSGSNSQTHGSNSPIVNGDGNLVNNQLTLQEPNPDENTILQTYRLGGWVGLLDLCKRMIAKFK